MDYRVGIIGYGTVGKGFHKLLKDDVVAIYDPAFPKFRNKNKFKDLDLIVISVPTPEGKNGECDTSLVFESINWAFKNSGDSIYLIKSTIPPSIIEKLYITFDCLKLVISPEFMGESSYFTPEWKYPHPQNMESHTWQVFGGEVPFTSLCVDIFKRHMGVDTFFCQTDVITASLCKYMENAFFAIKVTFCNEWFDIAKSFNVNYNKLREVWLLDPRINKNHTLVFPKKRGYSGKCFPKDIRAIIKDSEAMGYVPNLLKAVDETNKRIIEENNR